MPRAALILLFGATLAALDLAAQGIDPHLDSQLVPGGCASCHRGHGVSGSPMLPHHQTEVCMACHDSQSKLDDLVARGILSADARPTFMSEVLSSANIHPLTDGATSRHTPGAVTCTSCHLPHRNPVRTTPGQEEDGTPGTRKPSLRNVARFEYQLCGECHSTGDRPEEINLELTDSNRLLSSTNRSYHPVEAPGRERSPSVDPQRRGQFVNCTDCHGNSDPTGPRGPHGSNVAFLLRENYTTADGSEESLEAYALCYSCHDRETVLQSTAFPDHERHIVEFKASCATCHSGHGSVGNRALMRFGEETSIGSASASLATGRLAFVSDGPGSGACFLTCHGEDHAPEAYGSMKALIKSLEADDAVAGDRERMRRPAKRSGAPLDTRRPPKKTPVKQRQLDKD